MAWLRQTHGCALAVQMSSIGWNSEALSRVGKRTDMKPGLASPRVNKGEPHCAQKLRVATAPLLALTEWVLGVPVISMPDSATMKPEANGAPLERWQSRQWQLSIATGGREHT
jgi:hypothetical protein